jgi:A/G-specific adenine glycosylase
VPPYRKSIKSFQEKILEYYKTHGRKMPWRETRDPYCILVSEIMLQQTQVSRVEEKYPAFIEAFPNFKALDKAPLAKVYGVWQGLGYNRRALALKKIARTVISDYKGVLPRTHDELCRLPGIGRATASSIMAFAFNLPSVFVETNIRTVFIHFFFKNRKQVADDEILEVAGQCLHKKNPRVWYWALMDYGTMLKKSGEDKNARSKHYKKQERFEGSRRQIRGRILKILLCCNKLNIKEMYDRLKVVGEDKKVAESWKLKDKSEEKKRAKREELKLIVEGLIKEGMVRAEKGRFFL